MTSLPGDFASSRTATSRGDRARAHRLTALVDDEAAVGVAVEGQSEVRTLGDDGLLQVDQVRRVQRVRLVVGEGAVQLEVERHDVQRQPGEHLGHRVAGHPVARVDDHPQRSAGRQVDQAAQVGRVVGEHVALLDGARHGARSRRDALLDGLADRRQAGVRADGRRARPAQLDAVVLGRVVAGGEHRAGDVEGARGEVEHVRARQPDVDHVEAVRGDALGERVDQVGRRRAHVVADDDHTGLGRLRPQQPGQRRADLADERRVDLLTDDASDVVRLDHGGQVVAGDLGCGGRGAARGVRHGKEPYRWPRTAGPAAVGDSAGGCGRQGEPG